MSISTLKTAKVGDKVTMLTFTGMNLGQFEITKAGKTKICVTTKKGAQAEFSRETGIQTNANNPKFANKVVDPVDASESKGDKKADAKPEKSAAEKKSKKPTKKVSKVVIPDDADDFGDEDMDDDFEDIDD